MKKILGLIIGVCILLLVSTQESHAVLVEQDLTFTITSSNPTTNPNYFRFNFNKNMYEELDELYHDLTEDKPATSGVTEDWYATSIRLTGVTYQAYIGRYYSETRSSNLYLLQIQLNDFVNVATIYIHENAVTFTSSVASPSFSVSLSTSQALAYLGASTGSIRPQDYLGNYHMAEFVETELDPGEGIDVSHNFSLIPSTVGTLSDASDATKVGYVYFDYTSGYMYDTYIMLAGQQYNLGSLELPGVEQLNKAPLGPGIYWTEGNKRYIYYEFQQPPSVKPINEQVNIFLDDPSQINGFRPFVTMNLTDSTYTFTDKLMLYAGYSGGPNGQAYADVVFPFELDELLSIEILYQYRWIRLWGLLGYTPWQSEQLTRYRGQVVDMNTTWQHVTSYLFGGIVGGIYSQVTGWGQTIEEISVNLAYKNEYVELINQVRLSQGKSQLTLNQVFPPGFDVYRIYLNTFNDGQYTGYEIHDDIVIIDVMYKVDGEVFHVPYSDIEQGGSFGGGGGTGLGGQDNKNQWDWSWLTSLFDNIPTEYILIGIVILGVVFYKPIKKLFKNIQSIISNPRELIIFVVAILAILYFLGYL